ncbi:MAG: 2-amino-4-hydroxy-6-hydroxymethyldihydropteridine diphosphokinase [Pseudomonadota bacterium]
MSAFVGLGANIDNPRWQLQRAVIRLAALPETRFIRCSSLYASSPMGPLDQPDFLNAVAHLETRLAAISLLTELQTIECRQGRQRRRHWGERTLDLDLLVFGEHQLSSARLTLPHPGLAERPFVLEPLMEIAPELNLPGLGALADLAVAGFGGGPKGSLERVHPPPIPA